MGGSSREKEISFAGGRTIFDNLERTFFSPVPIFIDSFNNAILLDWRNLYKGSIPDFFPPYDFLPEGSRFQQYYASHISWGEEKEVYQQAQLRIGAPITWEALASQIDFAFLTLHGALGEDGAIQGILEWLGIPYSGTGIIGSAFAIDKILQKKWLPAMGFSSPPHLIISREDAFPFTPSILEKITKKVGFPCVLKNPTQGSSIGVVRVKEPQELFGALQKAFFCYSLSLADWRGFSNEHKISFLQRIMDERYEIGFPLTCNGVCITNPDALYNYLENAYQDTVELQALDSPEVILIEKLIEGEEFSVIVIETPDGAKVSLPPTLIRKPTSVYDYRAKYLPGIASKQTPMPAPPEVLDQIRKEAERLMETMHIEVYARIDGFYEETGNLYFNDPNTTSGMLPGSFLFHQAAEVGLSPSDFLTYLVYRSLQVRSRTPSTRFEAHNLLQNLRQELIQKKQSPSKKMKIAVVLGGASAERHISVESGRNVFQKLRSAGNYEPTPIFLLHSLHLKKLNIPKEKWNLFHIFSENDFSLWEISLPSLLKDNADDILQTIQANVLGYTTENYVASRIFPALAEKMSLFSPQLPIPPRHIPFTKLKTLFDFVFLALHGRPGEDGTIQTLLEQNHIPFNGSESHSARITIDKYLTGELLAANGLKKPRHILVERADWLENPEKTYAQIEATIPYPIIGKPVDDGCSSGVLLLENRAQLFHYCHLLFDKLSLSESSYYNTLPLQPGAEWEEKNMILFEEYISHTEGATVKEITVGFFTELCEETQEIEYFVLEPSEVVRSSSILSIEEKFLAGEGQNITPARFSALPEINKKMISTIKEKVKKAAQVLAADSYGRFDAFVKIFPNEELEVIFLELNALPGLTPATCIFHQTALAGLTPLAFLEKIINYGIARNNLKVK
jgi:D-alanine-D-alanine ligase